MANIDYFLKKYSLQLDKLKKYASMIHEQNMVMNISGFKTEQEIFEQGIIASLLTFEFAQNSLKKEFIGKKILDIGAGAGFPSVPLLIALDNSFELTIIESISKRCLFLEKVKKEFNLNLKIINSRAEEVIDLKEYFDFITARALSSTKNIYLMSNHLLKQNGEWILPKGRSFLEEVQEFKDKFLKEANNINFYPYFDFTQNENSFLVTVSKPKPTPRGWPWSWTKIKNY
ncbi:glucose-inhibited division protein B [Mycoplasmopsis maculosa]|uniref:Ribosomal RNA small subunit methyltransferase G n=1 Tax=Mycoplasmopsis maculosa TaxID=114885 RepID=A0A449B4Z1_9BACT|nr:16S rRNA (guanine(527)-N(7))-methyltransferase RsmG [Mycoplasmopsis maculosa]VEU75660.1 glucose-inhibited division protein B [Mycoplasmopsis maculosa]